MCIKFVMASQELWKGTNLFRMVFELMVTQCRGILVPVAHLCATWAKAFHVHRHTHPTLMLWQGCWWWAPAAVLVIACCLLLRRFAPFGVPRFSTLKLREAPTSRTSHRALRRAFYCAQRWSSAPIETALRLVRGLGVKH